MSVVMEPSPLELCRLVKLDEIPAGGLTIAVEPTADERRALARRLAIPAVEAFSGEARLRRAGGAVLLEGRLEARLARVCVASLEPMIEDIRERFALRFEPAGEIDEMATEDEDAPALEPLEGEAIDVGEAFAQQLALAMSAYPRREGARSLAETYADGAEVSPFAALRGLVDPSSESKG